VRRVYVPVSHQNGQEDPCKTRFRNSSTASSLSPA